MSEWSIVLVLKANVFYTIGSNPIISVNIMKNKIYIDKKKRLSYLKYEFITNILKSLLSCNSISIELKKHLFLEYLTLPKNSSIVRLHNICYMTGRSRGNYKQLKISRIKLKELISLGKLPGFLKSSW